MRGRGVGGCVLLPRGAPATANARAPRAGSAARPRSALRPRTLGRVARHPRGGARGARATMATVEQRIAVLARVAGREQKRRRERAAAQMQIEVRRVRSAGEEPTSAVGEPAGPASAPVDGPAARWPANSSASHGRRRPPRAYLRQVGAGARPRRARQEPAKAAGLPPRIDHPAPRSPLTPARTAGRGTHPSHPPGHPHTRAAAAATESATLARRLREQRALVARGRHARGIPRDAIERVPAARLRRALGEFRRTSASTSRSLAREKLSAARSAAFARVSRDASYSTSQVQGGDAPGDGGSSREGAAPRALSASLDLCAMTSSADADAARRRGSSRGTSRRTSRSHPNRLGGRRTSSWSTAPPPRARDPAERDYPRRPSR